ncbi:hypothetical protein [Litorihabitans aurantiacus]|uniref:Uncharacterized protein n=1 Tax=Litorihabitans aurantiacus TaxID=1930061 RepID=A0AA37XFW3_9MICO|nr:hypothetical protein [Litorihabitans aurantiacus]GMA32581.1 hypothetical protein GCM10025875_25730 [Litorihabitans aurantiacus]
MTITLRTALHTACLDPMTGVGVLVLPDPGSDVGDPLAPGDSLHAVDWLAMMRQLDAAGWEPLLGDWDALVPVDLNGAGRSAIALYGRSPITSSPTLREVAAADCEVAAAARRAVEAAW